MNEAEQSASGNTSQEHPKEADMLGRSVSAASARMHEGTAKPLQGKPMEHVSPTVSLTYHDDWIVNVLLSDGRVYAFITEMWWEHGDAPNGEHEHNWPRVERRARNEALHLAARGERPYADLSTSPQVVVGQLTLDQLRLALDVACEQMSDSDFRLLMRR